jgi:hypothetical protein
MTVYVACLIEHNFILRVLGVYSTFDLARAALDDSPAGSVHVYVRDLDRDIPT